MNQRIDVVKGCFRRVAKLDMKLASAIDNKQRHFRSSDILFRLYVRSQQIAKRFEDLLYPSILFRDQVRLSPRGLMQLAQDGCWKISNEGSPDDNHQMISALSQGLPCLFM